MTTINNSLSWIVGLVIIALLVGAVLGFLFEDWLRSKATIVESNTGAQKLTDVVTRVEQDLARLDNVPVQLQGLTNALTRTEQDLARLNNIPVQLQGLTNVLTRTEQTVARLDNVPAQLQGLTNTLTQATQARVRLEKDLPQIEAEQQELVQLRGAIRDMMLAVGLIVALAVTIGLSVNLIVFRRLQFELAKAQAALKTEQIRRAREMERLYREAVYLQHNGNGHGPDGNARDAPEYGVDSHRRVE